MQQPSSSRSGQQRDLTPVRAPRGSEEFSPLQDHNARSLQSPIVRPRSRDPTRDELLRVCVDVCSLMTCENIKEGLRTEGLRLSGVKDEISQRLGERLAQVAMLPNGPTIRQLKYILWIWRHRDMAWKHTLHYCEIVDKERISSLIHHTKDR